MIAADRDAVEARHVLGRIGDDVRDDPHRGLVRLDLGVADHELLLDVVLYLALHPVLLHPLFLFLSVVLILSFFLSSFSILYFSFLFPFSLSFFFFFFFF